MNSDVEEPPVVAVGVNIRELFSLIVSTEEEDDTSCMEEDDAIDLAVRESRCFVPEMK